MHPTPLEFLLPSLLCSHDTAVVAILHGHEEIGVWLAASPVEEATDVEVMVVVVAGLEEGAGSLSLLREAGRGLAWRREKNLHLSRAI